MTGHQSGLIHWFHDNAPDTLFSACQPIDLCQLDQQGINTGRIIIETLLKTDTLTLTLTPSSMVHQQLSRLALDHQNTLAYNNFHGLSIGFPIIRLQDQQKSYLAPLFLWRVHLKQQEHAPTWNLIHRSTDTIQLNLALYKYIKVNYKIDLSKLSHKVISNKNLNAVSLSKICYELSSALGKKEDLFVEQIQALSTAKAGNILCASVLGNFSDTLVFAKASRKKSNQNNIRLNHYFSPSTLDPSQEKVFHKITQQACTHLITDTGTGKSHLLHHALINGLSNGLTSLVIVDSADRIRKIRNEFSAHGLDQLMLDLSTPDRDSNKIIQALSYKSSVAKEDFDKNQFKHVLHQTRRYKDRLDAAFRVLNQNSFDKSTWQEIVGAYLRYQRVELQELLDNQLQAKDFTFHPTEYRSMKEAVNSSEPLYRKFNTLVHPLYDLHPDIFLEKNKLEARDFIHEKLDFFYKKFNQLHHRYILKQQDYAKNLTQVHEQFYQEALLKIEQLKDSLDDGRLLYGNDFEESGLLQTGKLKVYGVFSGKHKNILQARNQINEQFKALKIFLQKEGDHRFEMPENIDTKSISKVNNHLNELEDQLHQWSDQLQDRLQEDLQRLNTKSVHPNLDYAEQINELEYTLDMEIEALNTSGLYQESKENKMLTIPMRQLFIQELITKLQTSKVHLKDFDDFYDWQRHWLLLPEIHRKLLTAIIKVNPNNWKIAFQSWYFYQKLKADFHFKMPKDDQLLKNFEEKLKELRQLLPIQIRQRWKSPPLKRKSTKELSNLSLSELFTRHFELLTKQFPVIVTTTPIAVRLLKEQALPFDLGFVFRNTPDRSLSILHPAPAKHTLIFHPPIDDEIIHQSNFETLHYVHKKTPNPIFTFNHTFIHQTPQKSLAFSESPAKPYQVKNIAGQFQQGINIQEAEAIIRDITKDFSNAFNQFPKALILCLSIEQRDYIFMKIQDIINSKNSDAIPLQKAIDQGLKVIHFREPFSSNFERIYYSIGLHRFNDSKNEILSFLNTKNGYYLLKKVIGTPCSDIRLYHSMETSDLNSFLSYNTKKSVRLLASWIKYAEASTLQEQLAILNNQSTKTKIIAPQLSDEIANELIPFIGKNRIHLHKTLQNVQLPLVISPITKHGKSIAILCDACLNIESIPAHAWNIYFAQQLKSKNIIALAAWSANWFENPALEARRLASAILKMDKTS